MEFNYIRYSQVVVGDRVKIASQTWRNRTQADQHLAPFSTVTAIRPHAYSGYLILVTEDGREWSKPKTAKALTESKEF